MDIWKHWYALPLSLRQQMIALHGGEFAAAWVMFGGSK